MTDLQTISPERAAELVRRGAVLIDIREADEHARERIPGARHHALSRLDAESPARAGDEVLVFHCRSGARTRGHAARLSAARQTARPIFSMAALTHGRKPACPLRSIAANRSTSYGRCRLLQVRWY